MGAFKKMGMAVVPLFVGLVAIGMSVTAGMADAPGPADAAKGPVRCEIQKVTAGGSLTLTPVVKADMAVAGSYKFKVTGGSRGGSSTIDQGGPFNVAPDAPAKLGTVMVNAGGTYDASLTITWQGTTIACTERIGGI